MRKTLCILFILASAFAMTFASGINLEIATYVEVAELELRIADSENRSISTEEVAFSNFSKLNDAGSIFSDKEYSLVYDTNFLKDSLLKVNVYSEGLKTEYGDYIIDISLVDTDKTKEKVWKPVHIIPDSSWEGDFGNFYIKLTKKYPDNIIPSGEYFGVVQFSLIRD